MSGVHKPPKGGLQTLIGSNFIEIRHCKNTIGMQFGAQVR